MKIILILILTLSYFINIFSFSDNKETTIGSTGKDLWADIRIENNDSFQYFSDTFFNTYKDHNIKLVFENNPNINWKRVLSQLKQLDNLKRLYIGDHFLDSIPAIIGEFQQLEQLGFTCKNLRYIPLNIRYLKNLTHFSIYYSNLDRLDSVQLTNLLKAINPSIEKMEMIGNKLKFWPKEIYFPKIEEIRLEGNNFKTFPEFVLKCKELKSIRINADSNLIKNSYAIFDKLDAIQDSLLYLRVGAQYIVYTKKYDSLIATNKNPDVLPCLGVWIELNTLVDIYKPNISDSQFIAFNRRYKCLCMEYY